MYFSAMRQASIIIEKQSDGVAEAVDAFTIGFLRSLPPQQRLTLLLVCGERFDHIDAGRVLDVTAETVGARLVRIVASLADRLSACMPEPASAAIEILDREETAA